MDLPVQSAPVKRPLAQYSAQGRPQEAAQAVFGGGNAIMPSEAGVEASGWLDDVGKVAGIAGPLLGSFGI